MLDINFYLFINYMRNWASLVAQSVKNLLAMQETWVRFLGREDSLEKEMATHSNTLAWRIPWTEEPGGLQSMGSQSWTQLSDYTSSTTPSSPGMSGCLLCLCPFHMFFFLLLNYLSPQLLIEKLLFIL